MTAEDTLYRAWEFRRRDFERRLAHIERVFQEADADGTTTARLNAPFTFRWTYCWETEHPLSLCGFPVEH